MVELCHLMQSRICLQWHTTTLVCTFPKSSCQGLGPKTAGTLPCLPLLHLCGTRSVGVSVVARLQL